MIIKLRETMTVIEIVKAVLRAGDYERPSVVMRYCASLLDDMDQCEAGYRAIVMEMCKGRSHEQEA